jgi:hypothetical protein
MFALTKESRMDQSSRKPQHRNRVCLPLDLCGPYVFDEIDTRHVRCFLQMNHTELAIDIPAEVLRQHRLLGDSSEVVLRICGEQTVALEVQPILTDSQRKTAAGWSAEMGDFDRF